MLYELFLLARLDDILGWLYVKHADGTWVLEIPIGARREPKDGKEKEDRKCQMNDQSVG